MIRHKIYQILIIIFALTLSACEEDFVEAGILVLKDYSNFTCLKILEGHSGSVLSVLYSPDGTRIVSGSSDNTFKIWGEN